MSSSTINPDKDARRPQRIDTTLDTNADLEILDRQGPERGNAINQSAFLCNGFAHAWNRAPHRLGTFANYLDNERHTVDQANLLSRARHGSALDLFMQQRRRPRCFAQANDGC